MFFGIYIRVILSSVPMYSIAAQTSAGYEMNGILSLYENGTFKNSTESPYCSINQKLSLSSYTLKIEKCNNEDNRCQYQKKPLSPWAVMLLHEKCSFKKECDYVNFSSETKELKNDTLHSVLIDYQCLGDEDRLYEMCGHQTETVTSSVHLITGKESRQYSSCQCLLHGQNNSVITVTLKDIRLYSTKLSPRKCSESVLNINKKSFTCNSTSSAFGSVFNQPLSIKTQYETVNVSLDIEDPEFDMVWMLVETKGSMSVECTGKQREIATKSTEVFGHLQTSDIQSDGSVEPNRKDVEKNTILAVIGALVLVVTMATVCTVTAVIHYRTQGLSCRQYSIYCDRAPYGDRKEDENTGRCKANRKPEITEETLEIRKHWENRSENIEKAENDKPKSFRRRLVRWFRLFFNFKSIKSRQNRQHKVSVDSKKELVDKDASIQVDIHVESFDDTEDIPLSYKSNMSDCYGKANTGIPVQESGQKGRDDYIGKRQAYAKLCKHGELGNDENNDYDSTQSHNRKLYGNPTYSHLL